MKSAILFTHTQTQNKVENIEQILLLSFIINIKYKMYLWCDYNLTTRVCMYIQYKVYSVCIQLVNTYIYICGKC